MALNHCCRLRGKKPKAIRCWCVAVLGRPSRSYVKSVGMFGSGQLAITQTQWMAFFPAQYAGCNGFVAPLPIMEFLWAKTRRFCPIPSSKDFLLFERECRTICLKSNEMVLMIELIK